MLITRGTGENMDNTSGKGHFYLTDGEDALLRKLTEAFSHVAVIPNTGYPMDVTWAERYGVDAVLYSGFGGMLAGQALVDILSGKVSPSGKLPDTWAKQYDDIPASRNFYDSVDKPALDTDCGIWADTCYEEGLYVGYRYFTTFGKEPAYPFGFGLSYTTFDIRPSAVSWDGALKLTASVTNTGHTPGREVVQLYVRKPESLGETPERELAAFEKTKLLAPGEQQIISFAVPAGDLAVYDEQRAAWVMPAGEYHVFAGNDSTAPMVGSFHAEEQIIQRVSPIMVAAEKPVEMTKEDPAMPEGKRTGPKPDAAGFAPAGIRRHYAPEFHGEAPQKKLTYGDIMADPELTEDLVAQMTVEELARISVCASAGWGMEGVGEAGRIFKVEGYDLPDFPVSDGNSGVNLRIPNIGMPSTVTMCASFDKELLENIGRVIGEEAKALDMPLILAPGMNLHRHPMNGRQPEYFSEDPYLAGVLAGHYCRGMENAGVGSCIKHMIGNNCESTRKRNQSIIGQRTLRELYLKPFQVAMSVHMPASVMTGYNAVNGVHTGADEELIQGFLRRENGFDGIVMTDWGSYDTVSVPELVQAGNCWITPGSMDDTYTAPIVEGVKNGTVELDRLRENVTYMLRTIVRFAKIRR